MAPAAAGVGGGLSLLAGAFAGQIFGPTAATQQVPGQVGDAYEISGMRAARGTPFPLQVIYQRGGRTVTDTLSAVLISGP